MNRFFLIIITILSFNFPTFCQNLMEVGSGEKYRYEVDLTSARGDQVDVTLKTPHIDMDTLIFVFPSVVPGCYSYDDFGRFIDRFRVFDKEGKRKRDFDRVGDNAFFIYNASEIGEITYRVDDTWIDEYSNYVFQPCGSYIDRKEAFVINHHAFFGFYDGFADLPFEVSFKISDQMYAASALKPETREGKKVFNANSYAKLIDNPILVSKPDTASFVVDSTTFHIAIHSTGGTITAKKVQEIIEPDIKKIYNRIGVIPEEYHFLMFFTPGSNYQISKLGGFGALEHETSMLSFLPEEEGDLLKRIVSENVTHELVQLFAPINLRSNVFDELDYVEPEMCAHLWLYEGIVEYVTHLVRMDAGIIDKADFMEIFLNKAKNMRKYPDVSFTQKSKNILEPKYQEMFPNFFDRGALIGLVLDLEIRNKTNGEMNILKVLRGLTDNFGLERPFNEVTFMRAFSTVSKTDLMPIFNQFVINNRKLPVKDYLNKLGWYYRDAGEAQLVKVGRAILFYDKDEDQMFMFEGNSLGLRNRLELVGIKVGSLNVDMNKPKGEIFEGLKKMNGQNVVIQYKRDSNFLEASGRLEVMVVRLDIVIQEYLELSPNQQKLNKLFFD